MVIKLTEKNFVSKYDTLNGYTKDVDRIRMYAVLNKTQICDFIELLVDEWENKNPEFKNILIIKEV